MKRARWLLYALLVVAGLLGTLVVVARCYLTSAAAARQVADRLTELLGEPVQVDAVDLGLTSQSSFHGIKVLGSADGAPWLTIDNVSAAVSAWQLRDGVLPPELDVTGVALTLDFDREGRLLTRLPGGGGGQGGGGTLPLLRIHAGRVTLRQQGRPDLVLGGVEAGIESKAGALVLAGSVHDPDWGAWSLDGRIDLAKGTARASFATPHVHLAQARLEGLPFVPAVVWQQVQLEGDTPVTLALSFGGAAGVSYRVELEPSRTKLHVTAIDLDAEQAGGKVVIEDGVVHLCDIHGQTAEGAIHTDARLDFSSCPCRLNFAVGVEELALQRLPERWSIPRTVEGRLTGQADLLVTIANGQVRTTGQGEGRITLRGLERHPLRIKLHADGDGIRFTAQGDRTAGQAAALARTTPGAMEVDLTLDDADIPHLLRGLSLGPLPVTGCVSFHAHLTIPGDAPDDLRAYQLQGDATLAGVRVAGLGLERVRGRIRYADGVLHLEDVQGRLAASGLAQPWPVVGAVAGHARLELVPRGDLDARLTLVRLALGPWLQGAVSGTLEASVPLGQAQEVTAWKATAALHSDRLTARGWSAQEVSALAHLRRGTVSVAPLQATVEGAAVLGTAELGLAPPFHYAAKVQAVGDLQGLRRLSAGLGVPRDLAGRASAGGEVQGTLRPFTLETTGSAGVEALRLDAVHVPHAQLCWQGDATRLHLTDIGATLYQGEVAGAAELPLQASEPGSLELRFDGVDVGALADDLPGVPLRLSGQAGGTVVARLEAEDGAGHREAGARLELTAPRLGVQHFHAEQVHGSFGYERGVADYALTGETLGGQFQLDGRLPLEPAGPGPKGRGRLHVEHVQLARIWTAVGAPAFLALLRGNADLQVAFRHAGPQRAFVGEGRFLIDRLRWGSSALSGDLRGDVNLSPEALRVEHVTGILGDGLLRGHGTYSFDGGRPTAFRVVLERVAAERLLAPWPEFAGLVQGPLEINLRGTLHRECRISGQAVLARGKVLGLEVSEWRLPLEAVFSPARGHGRVSCPEYTVGLARGRVAGQASVTWGAGLGVQADARFQGVDLRNLLGPGSELGQVGAGLVSGRLELDGQNVQGVDDLTGSVDASFQDTAALTLPVLRELTRYLLPGKGGAIFGSGDLHARLARGVIQVRRLALRGSLLRVLIEGTVALQGRLDLEVTASPNPLGGDRSALGRLIARLPPAGAIPLTLLAEAATLLSPRLLHLRVSGSVRNPTVRVETLTALTEDVLRFVLDLTP
jgi:hypothetical protein